MCISTVPAPYVKWEFHLGKVVKRMKFSQLNGLFTLKKKVKNFTQ